jgi:hypothetical protein
MSKQSTPVFVVGNELVDAKYGPYLSTTQCTNLLLIGDRKIGQTVGIYNGTGIDEYWFRDGIEDGDLVAKSSGGTGGGILHGTASGTDTYTVSITGVTAYNDGDAYLIRFTNGNTTGCTLNINSLGAKTLYRNNDGVLIGGDIVAGGEMICVYNSTTDGFQAIGTAPNTLLAYVTNADSVTLTKGMPVYAFGGQGDRLTVKRAKNTGDSTSAQTIGLVLSASIGVNQKGLIMMRGLLDGLSILPTSTWADGDPVYLGATDGSITKTKPYAPNHLVYLGFVTTASNGSAGRLYVAVQNGYELQELHNVQAQSPNNKDSIFFDSADSQWKARAVSATDIDSNVSNTEFGYLNGVTSAIQTQIDGKQATLTNPVTGTGTNNEIAAFNSTGSTITSLSTSTYPSLTEFSYVKGVTSAIQTQINALPRVVYTDYTAETTTSTTTTNALTTFSLTIADADWPLGGVLRLSGLMERTAGSGSIFMGVVCNGSTARYIAGTGQNIQWEWQIMKEAASTLRIGMGPSNTGNGSYAVHNQSTVTATASGGNYVFTFYMFVGTAGATASMRWMKGILIP